MKTERSACLPKISHIMSALVVLAGLSLTPRVRATETVIHSFTGPDGAQPTAALTPDGAGNYFGTTLGGGSTSRFGTVFELSPTSGGWMQTVLYNFAGSADGGQPASEVVRDASGNLYGTTSSGGSGCTGAGCGVVFKLSQSGGVWTETVLYSFTGGSDGRGPNGVILDSSGNLYGTLASGGDSNGDGVVYELSPNSSGTWTKTVIYSFTGGTNGGRNPNGNLVFDSAGRLYGTTAFSGTGGGGLAYRLTPNGTVGWTENVLHNFSGHQDGSNPNGGLVLDAKGRVYGTAQAGGNLADCNRFGCGVVFRLARKSGGGWTETVLHSFTGGTDGGVPLAGVVTDSAGKLYGTTFQGGDPTFCGGQGGCGVVFELSPGSTGYTETVLHTFTDSPDGAFSGAALVRDSSGNLFGTTFDGGIMSDCSGVGCGVVFEVTP